MPPQQGVRRRDRGDLPQGCTADSVRSRRQPTAIFVRQTQPTSTELTPQKPVLFDQVRDCLPLLAGQPASERAQHDLQRRGVDHEAELVASCERLLRRAGHMSLRAYTGPEAIALIDSDQPDLVVADLRLPKADGLAVARHARAQVPPIPVILITAYDSSQARQAASEAGVEAYLAKPFSNAEFLQAVLRILPSKSVDELGSGHR
jgi:CheY-like chemotaxis protein